MKRILILLGIIGLFVLGFSIFDGIALIIFLFIVFPLVFFYLPLLFRMEKKEELTEEAKKEQKNKYSKWD